VLAAPPLQRQRPYAVIASPGEAISQGGEDCFLRRPAGYGEQAGALLVLSAVKSSGQVGVTQQSKATSISLSHLGKGLG
jgi:uncharacterized ferredoxin-like protein